MSVGSTFTLESKVLTGVAYVDLLQKFTEHETLVTTFGGVGVKT